MFNCLLPTAIKMSPFVGANKKQFISDPRSFTSCHCHSLAPLLLRLITASRWKPKKLCR